MRWKIPSQTLAVITAAVIRAIATLPKLPVPCHALGIGSSGTRCLGCSQLELGKELEYGEYFVPGVQRLSGKAWLAKCMISDSSLVPETRRLILKVMTSGQTKPTPSTLGESREGFWRHFIPQNPVLQNCSGDAPVSELSVLGRVDFLGKSPDF